MEPRFNWTVVPVVMDEDGNWRECKEDTSPSSKEELKKPEYDQSGLVEVLAKHIRERAKEPIDAFLTVAYAEWDKFSPFILEEFREGLIPQVVERVWRKVMDDMED